MLQERMPGIALIGAAASAAVVTLLASSTHAAVFSSVADGSYNASSTWGGSTNPSTGVDTVTINHAVAITSSSWPANDTIGFGNDNANLSIVSNTSNLTYSAAAWNLTGSNQTITINRVSNGTGSISQTLSGALTLGNGKTLTVAAGNVLTSSNAYALTFSGAATVTGTQTVTIDSTPSTGSFTLSGLVSGTGGFVKNGSGTFTLSGDNTFQGNVTLNSGTLRIGSSGVGTVASITSGAIGKGAVTLNAGTLSSNNTSARSLLNSWTLAGDMTFGNGTNNGQLTLSGAGTISGATRNLTTASAVVIDGDIGEGSSGLGLTKLGSSSLTLSGTNTFTGTLAANAGTLRLGSAGAWNAAASNLVVSNAVLELGGGNVSANAGTGAGEIQVVGATPGFGAAGAPRTLNLGSVTWGSANFNPTTALQLGSATSDDKLTFATNIDLGGGGRQINVVAGSTANATVELSGNVSGTAPASAAALTFNGGGTIVISGANTYNNAATTVAGTGTVIIGGTRVVVNSIGGWSATPAASSLGAPTTSFAGRVSVSTSAADNSGTLVYAGSGETTERTIAVGKGDPTLEASGTGAWVINSFTQGAVGSNSQIRLTLGGTNTDDNMVVGPINSVDPAVASYTRVTKTGPGTWVMGNDSSTFSYGPLNINGGTIVAKGNVEASTFRTGTFTNGATTITVSDATGLAVGDYVYGTNTNGESKRNITAISGNVLTLSAATNFGGTDAPLEIVNAAAQSSALGSSKVRLTLGSALTTTNGWDASLLIDGGYNIARTVLVNNNATTGTYTVGGRSTSAAATFSGLVTTNQPLTFKQASGGTLNITGGVTGSTVVDRPTQLTFAGPGTINVSTVGISDGTGGGTGNVSTLLNGGTTTFAVASTYTGGTIVNVGTLLVNNTVGSGTGSGAVNVNAGTIGGNGTIAGALIVGNSVADITADAVLAPGNSIDSIDTGNLEFQGDGKYLVELDATSVTSDVTNVTGTVQLGSGVADLQVALGGSLVAGQKFWIINNDDADAIGGFFASLPQDATVLTNGLVQLKISYTGGYDVVGQPLTGGNDAVLYAVAVPEPATLSLLGLAGLLVRRKRSVR